MSGVSRYHAVKSMPAQFAPPQFGSSCASTRPSVSSSIAPSDTGGALLSLVQLGAVVDGGAEVGELPSCTGAGFTFVENGGNTPCVLCPVTNIAEPTARHSAIASLLHKLHIADFSLMSFFRERRAR